MCGGVGWVPGLMKEGRGCENSVLTDGWTCALVTVDPGWLGGLLSIDYVAGCPAPQTRALCRNT